MAETGRTTAVCCRGGRPCCPNLLGSTNRRQQPTPKIYLQKYIIYKKSKPRVIMRLIFFDDKPVSTDIQASLSIVLYGKKRAPSREIPSFRTLVYICTARSSRKPLWKRSDERKASLLQLQFLFSWARLCARTKSSLSSPGLFFFQRQQRKKKKNYNPSVIHRDFATGIINEP